LRLAVLNFFKIFSLPSAGARAFKVGGPKFCIDFSPEKASRA